MLVFFFMQTTAYELRISDWSADVCSSDLSAEVVQALHERAGETGRHVLGDHNGWAVGRQGLEYLPDCFGSARGGADQHQLFGGGKRLGQASARRSAGLGGLARLGMSGRSEEHTSELQSLMRISYAVFCLRKKTISKLIKK